MPKLEFIPYAQRVILRSQDDAKHRIKWEKQRDTEDRRAKREENRIELNNLLYKSTENKNINCTISHIDDTDDLDNESEYNNWKQRELMRLERDHIECTTQNTVEYSTVEISKDLVDKSERRKVRHKYLYMQKYYHKGSFFQDKNEPLYNRDFNLPTEEDKVDKTIFPKILQLRRGQLGKSGQSKHKTLRDEDTMSRTSLFYEAYKYNNISGKYKNNTIGNNTEFDRISLKRK
ncbi:hypothetical protein cand_006780 [Cryptosporidium andersoni]|uniref:Micro-fibrillar-associated protein 1 C-terminal domain-containing protein n=1 Tax=Cryptosporidium andersoni TaxID=117008 RepID=A0A1J4MQ09_9CRYT|nr:hypothetical protein cand_006780 [Cryptosporidium andersoni]